MAELDLLVKETLERQVPLRSDARPDWTDVLRRAEVVSVLGNGRPRPRRVRRRGAPRRLMLAAALAALAVVATALTPAGPALGGLGRDAFDGLSSWLGREPGEPAPAEEQAGFSERNAASYASFPADTKLRLLLRQTVGGKALSLLGFRNGSSLCLRLVRADLPGGRGENQCVTLRELERYPAPALVAAQAGFSFGEEKKRVDGVFGFVDDTVQAVEVRRARSGWTRVHVANNVFLALSARPSGTVKHPPPFDPIVQVRAVTLDGDRVRVPFVANDSGDYGQGLPGVPSYLKPPSTRLEDLPGPSKIEAPFSSGTIGWLERREARGEPFAPDRPAVGTFGTIVFARKIQPDPESPVRVGATLVRIAPGSWMRNARPGQLAVCASEIRPLGRGTGFGCPNPGPDGLFPAGEPLTVSFMGPEQLTQLAGLAADEVASIDLHLASGRIVPAALRDNAFLVQAPTTQLPGKLVAYDERHRVIGLQPLPGAARPAPCPHAVFSGSAASSPRPYERIDLGTARIDGHEIFGRGVAEVVAVLGGPDRIGYFSSTNGIREPTLFYGGTRPGKAALEVRFGVRQKRLRAFSLNFNGPTLVDARLGQVLRLQPLELQRRIAAAYGERYDLGIAYGSEPGRGCIGIFQTARRNLTVTFGVNPYYGSPRPSLTIWHGY
jgi:hypothetical protein